jgi:hypothetical protein
MDAQAATREPVSEGFSADTIEGVCQAFYEGRIDRRRVVDELARWPYSPTAPTDGYDWLVDDSNTFGKVTTSLQLGLIDREVYEALFERLSDDGS